MQIICMVAGSQDVDNLKLKDFRPVSIFKVPQSKIVKANQVIDFHSHDYVKTDAELDDWVKRMDELKIGKTLILSYATGAGFDSIVHKYSRYKERFEIWWGFDYTGHKKPGWGKHAVAELEKCYRPGATGVGELGDKGLGEIYSVPTAGYGLHIDNPSMKTLPEKCAELNMPVSIHVQKINGCMRKSTQQTTG